MPPITIHRTIQAAQMTLLLTIQTIRRIPQSRLYHPTAVDLLGPVQLPTAFPAAMAAAGAQRMVPLILPAAMPVRQLWHPAAVQLLPQEQDVLTIIQSPPAAAAAADTVTML